MVRSEGDIYKEVFICSIESSPSNPLRKIAIGRKMKCAVNHSCKKDYLTEFTL